MRPADVTGKPLIPSCSADTMRNAGTNKISDAAIISAGSRNTSDQYRPKEIRVAMSPPAMVANTSGALKRPMRSTVAIISDDAPSVSKAENHEPPIKSTKEDAQRQLARNETQFGKVF